MAKIAARFGAAEQRCDVERALLTRRTLAGGEGWTASDIACYAGPRDRTHEEQHTQACIAIVASGSFQYQSSAGRELMTPGSLLLGSPGQHFECGHEHGVGGRCISFAYDAGFFESLASETGVGLPSARFAALRVPPKREFARLITRASASLAAENTNTAEWEEIAIELAVRTLELANNRPSAGSSLAAEARVTRIVRMIESQPDQNLDIVTLAREARLSRYHFLRVFHELTGLTPHRYVVRSRLNRAAIRLSLEPVQVVEIALNSGFDDVSSFNRAFRAEFGVSPSIYRKNLRRG
ncbi:MAG TPA: AraC family transcriptional regulator [Terracidiphilus sp.]|nr:AraC family transcriptional regulator [Terracidiphilus sp.]